MAASLQNAFPQEPFDRVLTATKQMIPLIEKMDTIYSGTGEELVTLAEAMTRYGAAGDVMKLITDETGKQKQGFVALAEAIKAQTGGVNVQYQIMQEIRALMEGRNVAGAQLLRYLTAQNKELAKMIPEWREQGTLIENIAPYLEGYVKASEEVSGLLSTMRSTWETIVNRILRGALEPAYKDIVGYQRRLNELLIDGQGELTATAQTLQVGVRGAWEAILLQIQYITASLDTIWKASIPSMLLALVGVEGSLGDIVKLTLKFQAGMTMGARTIAAIAEVGVQTAKIVGEAFRRMWEIGMSPTRAAQLTAALQQWGKSQFVWIESYSKALIGKVGASYVEELKRIDELFKFPAAEAVEPFTTPGRLGGDKEGAGAAAKKAVEASQAYRKLLETQIELARTTEERQAAEQRLMEWAKVAYEKYAGLFRKTHIVPYGEWAVEIRTFLEGLEKTYIDFWGLLRRTVQEQGIIYKLRVHQQEEESAHLEEYARSYQGFVTGMARSLSQWALSLDLPRLRLRKMIDDVVRLRDTMDVAGIALRAWTPLFGLAGEAAARAFDKMRYGSEEMERQAKHIALIWENALQGIQSAWSSAIYSMMKGMSGFADFLKSTWDAILQSISELIAAHVAGWIAEITGLAKALKEPSTSAMGDAKQGLTFNASPELLQALSYFGAGVTVFELASGNWVRAAVSLVATIALQRMAAAAQVSAAAGQASAAVTQVAAATTNNVAAGISTVAATASVTAGGVMGVAMGIGASAAVMMVGAAATMMAAAVIMAGVKVGLGLFGLQHGGLVTKPTVALLGEKGPELVTPLSKLGPGLGDTFNISQRVTVDSLDEPQLRRLARRTVGATGHELWRARLRRSGGVA